MRFLFVCFTIVSLFSCTKFDWNNPYDPECPKELFTPSSPGATMEGNSVKLTWSQRNEDISGFTLYRRAEGESISSLTQTQKSVTQYLDASVTAGKKYTYFVLAVAGTNKSDTIKVDITLSSQFQSQQELLQKSQLLLQRYQVISLVQEALQ